MNRQGAALAAALLVVLLGGVLVATSVTWAVAELRAGSSWSARARSEAASSGLIDMLPDFQAWLAAQAVFFYIVAVAVTKTPGLGLV